MRLKLIPRRNVVAHGAESPRGDSGAVLLEVILALALFVGAAAVLTSGLSSSLDGVERLRRNAHAADFAISVLSELQMGITSLGVSGPQPFVPPEEGWTWEIAAAPIESGAEESSPFQRIEVIIRHDDPPLVYRLNQVLRADALKSETDRPGIDGF
jgi:hypothetical protein